MGEQRIARRSAHGRDPRPRGRPDRPDHCDAARPGRSRRDRAGAGRRRSAGRRAGGGLDRLASSPLAGTALGPDLRASLLAGIARLAEEPKGEPLCRVLDRTYLCGTPSQEAAAEVLGLPFSTYRRHLSQGVDRVVVWLWDREVYGEQH